MKTGILQGKDALFFCLRNISSLYICAAVLVQTVHFDHILTLALNETEGRAPLSLHPMLCFPYAGRCGVLV